MLSEIPEISFRSIPDPAGDSCTFLSWFLPNSQSTAKLAGIMKEENILAGNFYWFNNNWHYIHKWDHLKNSITLNALSPEIKSQVIHHANKDFLQTVMLL